MRGLADHPVVKSGSSAGESNHLPSAHVAIAAVHGIGEVASRVLANIARKTLRQEVLDA